MSAERTAAVISDAFTAVANVPAGGALVGGVRIPRLQRVHRTLDAPVDFAGDAAGGSHQPERGGARYLRARARFLRFGLR